MIKKKDDIATTCEWPQNYYMEFDPARRHDILESQSDPDNSFRRRLYELRYTRAKNGKITDNFARCWLLMKIDTNTSANLLTKGKLRKTWTEYANSLCLSEYASYSENEQLLLRMEWNAFFMQFIHTCSIDRTYGSTFFGVIPLTRDALSNKVGQELELITLEYPDALGLKDLFSPLYQCALEAYQNSSEI